MAKERSTGFRFKKITDLIRLGADNDMKQIGLTFSQFHVLLCLKDRSKEMTSLKELEKFFQVSQATMAGIIVRLEQKEYIHSCIDPEDRRVKLVQITEQGKQACEKAHGNMVEREKKIFRDFSEDDRKKLNELLDKVLNNLKEMNQEDAHE